MMASCAIRTRRARCAFDFKCRRQGERLFDALQQVDTIGLPATSRPSVRSSRTRNGFFLGVVFVHGVHHQSGNDGGNLFSVERDLAFCRWSPGTRWKIVGHFRAAGRWSTPAACRPASSTDAQRFTDPLMREQVAKVLPRLIQLILEVAAASSSPHHEAAPV